jgi:predicted O-methyltransferase YrrM
MDMTPQRWDYTSRYSQEVFGAQDDHLAGLMTAAIAEGLPPIAVSADVGRLLQILTSMTEGRLAIEIGTLGGYSGIWITRGLRPDGRLITIEYEPHHARFARDQFERAGLGNQVEVRVGAALDVLPSLMGELEPGSVDVVFLDAVKSEYTQYFELVKPLVAVGGLVLADNVYGTSEGWIDQGHGTDPFNRLIASDRDFETVAVPLREGVLIALRIN